MANKKKTLKWLVVGLSTPIQLFIILAALIYIPPVQDWMVRNVTKYAARQTGMDISVDRVRLVFPLDLGVENFRMIQQNDSLPQGKDTVANVGRLVASVQLLPLLKGQVEINALEFEGVKLNTADFIHEARIKGDISKLRLKSHGINLKDETVRINEALLHGANVNIELSDTVPADTTESQTKWKIALDKLKITQTNVTVHMPGDTLQIAATLGKTEAEDGLFDLGNGIYRLKRLSMAESGLEYDNNFEARTKGLDFNHISLDNLNIGIDTLYYKGPKLNLALNKLSFKEKSGITVSGMSGHIAMDSAKITIPDLALNTPNSCITAEVDMDLNSFDNINPGRMSVTLNGALGKQDIMQFVGGLPTDFIRRWPNYPLTIKTVVRGNMKRLNIAGLNAKLPSAFNLNINGHAENINDPDNLKADIKLKANTYDLGFINALTGGSKGGNGINIPHGITIDGRLTANKKQYAANVKAVEGGGNVSAEIKYNDAAVNYAATVDAVNFNIGDFLPGNGIGPLTGNITIKGHGTNFMSTNTSVNASANIEKFNFGQHNFDHIDLTADINKGKAYLNINSDNTLLKGSATIDALIRNNSISSTLVMNLQHADFHGLHVTKAPFSTSLCTHIDIATDLKHKLDVYGSINDITFVDSGKVYHPDDIHVDILTSKDTTHAAVNCGDFALKFNGKGDYNNILNSLSMFQKELAAEIEGKNLNIKTLIGNMPETDLYLKTGKENPFGRFASHMGYSFQNADINISSSPDNGLNGNVTVLGLQNSNVKLDTIRFNIISDSTQCRYFAQVRNNLKNKQYVFNAMLDGYMFDKGLGNHLKVYDARDSLGLKIGVEASMEETGIKLRLSDEEPILGYKHFAVNEDNYLFMGKDRRISSKMILRAGDGMGVHIYTNDENTDALQDLTVSLNRFDLEKVLSVIPYVPDITGIMNGDFHIIKTTEELSVSTSLSVDNMTYERSRMGDLSTEFVYMPKSDGTHSVDGILMCNDKQVADINGSYNSTGGGNLDVNMNLEKMPMRLLNGFMPDRILRFRGYADGSLDIKGTLNNPQANGRLTLDSCYIRSPQYGVSLRLSEKPIRVVGSNILFEDFNMFASNDNPLSIDGNIDFSDMSNMRMKLDIGAENFKIIDSKERRRSVAFGKAFVDITSTIHGPVNNLKMLGRINVLGSTDVSYILKDSPLSADNRMNELVKFVSFEDTTATEIKHEPLTGFTMNITMNIDKGAHIMCYLNADKSNYLDLIGGGNLRMKYDANEDLRLTGRYTLDAGEMKYSLPVIPLKTFNIKENSYIEFTGDPMNPRLNITATEHTKSNVSTDGGQGRTVEFECGVVITKTLSDMGLEFILNAPEDLSLQNELNAMGREQRGKLAVTMLTTGMYIADGNTSDFSMNNALSSFLQSEINSITGNALRTLDLSFGMDNSQDASGNTHTDYSFKFAKRFWNNRMRIVVGGKVSTGAEVENQNESFFDNVMFEYRLGNSSDKYVKLFYDNNAYDWLEGNTSEYGVGFIWRRSLQHFKDIFRFKKEKKNDKAPSDSTKTNNKKDDK